MNVLNYDFEPRREEGDFVDNIDSEVEVLDIETEDWRLESTCTECVRMPTTPECLCCKELALILEYRWLNYGESYLDNSISLY